MSMMYRILIIIGLLSLVSAENEVNTPTFESPFMSSDTETVLPGTFSSINKDGEGVKLDFKKYGTDQFLIVQLKEGDASFSLQPYSKNFRLKSNRTVEQDDEDKVTTVVLVDSVTGATDSSIFVLRYQVIHQIEKQDKESGTPLASEEKHHLLTLS